MKMQCGSEPTVGASIERVRVMRESIGPDVDLMCDINQLWSVNQAIEVGRRIEPYHLFWLEDPTTHDDYPGLARIADNLATPIAAGEYHYGITPFRHLLEARSIDIVMIDLVRAGGITQWMKVAGMAEAFNLPVVSHLIPEIHVHLVAAIPNGLTVEYMPWTLRLFEETPAIEVGRRIEPYHLFWLEDPTAHDDFPGLARIAAALTAPIAAGEYHYGIAPFRHMLEARSIDIVMIDLVRAGGITQWMKIAGMAEAFNLPVVSHLIPEIHVHLIAAIPNGLTVEYMPWTLRLFEETPKIENGHLVVPAKPGLGLAFDQAAIKKYEVA
jgi:L-alanine-DL-glutamate epimerase-like enolase superfamily enzyme